VNSPEIATLFERPQYGIPSAEKSGLLLNALNELTAHHRARCPEYEKMLTAHGIRSNAARDLPGVPWIPIGVFKSSDLKSVPASEVFKYLTSSGTTGSQVSRVALDRETATLQSRALNSIMSHVLGPRRLPMILVDHPGIIQDRERLSARGAGLLGMMVFGRHHLFALNEDMEIRADAVKAFLQEHKGSPILVFGFTFMVWQYFYKSCLKYGIDLDLNGGILIHSGGWKSLADQAVDRETFARSLGNVLGIEKVYNFYGMAEQVGSVFLEGATGHLHAPNFADIIIRDPVTWEEAPDGEVGVIEVLSVLPRSYPGHALLTDDLGVVHDREVSPDGRHGKRFTVKGRVPKVHIRGCSDTHASEAIAQSR
jgi:Acyl-protein synthetase, LuxE